MPFVVSECAVRTAHSQKSAIENVPFQRHILNGTFYRTDLRMNIHSAAAASDGRTTRRDCEGYYGGANAGGVARHSASCRGGGANKM